MSVKRGTAFPTVVGDQGREAIMNKDQIKGLIEEVHGEAREVAVQLPAHENLELKSTIRKVRGRFRLRLGDLSEYLGKAM
jgi:hypothetical protein